jgi:DNA-binding NtrC family response regulator
MRPQRILIIEDEENIRHTMRMALETEGYDVETAVDGPEGLLRFREPGQWGLVLLDQRMPGMQGVEVLRELKAIDSRVPVILITAYGTLDLAAEVLASGASGFLRRPFTPVELRGVVRETLATRKGSTGVPAPATGPRGRGNAARGAQPDKGDG